MAVAKTLPAATLLMMIIFAGGSSGAKVAVGVFYEPLCSKSKDFIANQLLPTYEEDPDRYSVTLVPYGKTQEEQTSDGHVKYTFLSDEEYVACLVHSCAILHVTDELREIKYISCMMQNKEQQKPLEIGKTCAAKIGDIEWDTIESCSEGNAGIDLLDKNREMTQALTPAISDVPTIVIDRKRVGQADLTDFQNIAKHTHRFERNKDGLTMVYSEDEIDEILQDQSLSMAVIMYTTLKAGNYQEPCKEAILYCEKQAKAEQNDSIVFCHYNIDHELGENDVSEEKMPTFTFVTANSSKSFDDINSETDFLQKYAEFKQQASAKIEKIAVERRVLEAVSITDDDDLEKKIATIDRTITTIVILYYLLSDEEIREKNENALSYFQKLAKEEEYRDVMFYTRDAHDFNRGDGDNERLPMFSFFSTLNGIHHSYNDITSETNFIEKLKEHQTLDREMRKA